MGESAPAALAMHGLRQSSRALRPAGKLVVAVTTAMMAFILRHWKVDGGEVELLQTRRELSPRWGYKAPSEL